MVKTAVSSEETPDPYEVYRVQYKKIMTSAAHMLRRSLKFANRKG